MIHASHLSKSFGDRVVVDDVSFDVEAGQIFGLLGPNAAGKTTTIRILCGIIEHDKGEVSIEGKPLQQVKLDIGYVSQHFGQYEELSVHENLTFYARMYGVKDSSRIEQLMQRYDLQDKADQAAGALSGGFQRRLAIACALAHDPAVLFLDEPTAGIDPVTRKHLWDDFYQLSAEGKTLFVTTHYMEEAQRCHRLAFISAGRLVAQGTPSEVRSSLSNAVVYATRLGYTPELHAALQKDSDVQLINQFGDELRLVLSPDTNVEKLSDTIGHITGETHQLSMVQANLEDVFIALTQP